MKIQNNNVYRVKDYEMDKKYRIRILKKVFNLEDSSQLIYTLVILIFGIALLPRNYSFINFFETNIYRYLSIGIIVLGLFILLISNLKKGDSND